jgi:DNA processing protein
MDLEDTKNWLALAQQPYALINQFLKQLSIHENQQPTSLFIQQWLDENNCLINHQEIDHALLWLNKPQHHLCTFNNFPQSLKSINNPPALLFLVGDIDLLYRPQIAIVGSRKPTGGGCENATFFARTLAEAGITIISGLAIGIDGLAHQATLDVNGSTIAVLGCGHETCYPKKHQELFNSIKRQGLLISEFAPQITVRAHQFPQRNRIISALSLAVLVVEAAIKSGSLITCRLAADQGRDVFAIPGDITNPMSQGCHHLIRNGACLVTDPEQIIEALNFTSHQQHFDFQPVTLNVNAQPFEDLSEDENTLLRCINRHPTSVDRLIIRSGMKMALVLSVLFSLELKNIVIATADGYFKNNRSNFFQ